MDDNAYYALREKDRITEDEAVAMLEWIKANLGGDKESAHMHADDVLLSLVNSKRVADAYDEIDKWYA
jgi:hypothetical protein